ncbi:MAG: serine hydrolase [Cytophagales bacterium CG12_big_fil_rev_8_21_14_0_65_40_12]|nr:MAG: serine hydrolase [Cytophagales bacterium CG12_big_fil_rev_8_21_14_0_65_40_12]PIW03541.1 MAG: serine hydrolase [Cytophagales bacterium CG17_big_fil_post_rev_8_21_14_2_50_40_13]
MKSALFLTIFLLALSLNAQVYFPERGKWETKSPQSLGLNAEKLANAVKYAEANEYSGSKDLRVAILEGFKAEPFHKIAGPTRKRGGPAGVIIKDGYIVAQWGDVNRVDMTFSTTKSYLSTMAGLALDAGLIANVQDKVGDYVWDGTFDGDHNAKITWHMLLNQSSDWSGELWGGKDWADRPPRQGGLDEWKYRELKEPGTFMEYNDVRVNVLAYSLLHVWRKPLPQVLKEAIMDPIGASTTWRWFGYDNAWVDIDGAKMQSVTGGGHSGGGIFISALDHARFGLLFLNNGKWKNQQLISQDWVDAVQVPSEAMESYGYMWWLNRGPRKWKEVEDESIYYAAGFGGNFIVVDKKNNMVLVARWLEPDKIGPMMKLVQDAFK